MSFEAKKTYRTQHGRTAQVCNDHGAAHSLPYRIVVLGDCMWAARDGAFKIYGDGDRMLPGAIEDEKPKVEQAGLMVVDAFEMHRRFNVVTDTMDELRRRINVQGTTIAGMAAKIEGMQVYIDGSDARFDNHGTRLMNLQDRICKLEDRVDYHGIRLPTPEPTKPTIKGGWVNVMDAPTLDQGRMLMGPYDSRDEADSFFRDRRDPRYRRLACIQIPDFTEGEGL